MAADPRRTQFTRRQWAQDFLRRIGAPDTAANELAVVAWEYAEGGHFINSAWFNPLNTTQPAAGASSMNSVGVKSYPDYETGMAATIQTISQPGYGYPAIIAALRAGNSADAVAAAITHSSWGTKDVATAFGLAGHDLAGTLPPEQTTDPSGAAVPLGPQIPTPPNPVAGLAGLADLAGVAVKASAWVANRHNWIRVLEIGGGFVGLIVAVFLISDDLNVSSVAKAAKPVAEAALVA